MSKKTYVNNKTGEIVEMEELCPFCTLLSPKSDGLNDVESYEAGTSVTSLEGYEPLESIVARCMRTVKSPNGSVYQVLDTDALKAEETQQGVYEASGAQTLDEAFATMDPTESQGFDLADASNIQKRLGEELAKTSSVETSTKLSTKGTNEVLNNEVSDVVGNSVSKSETDGTPPEKEKDIFPERGK